MLGNIRLNKYHRLFDIDTGCEIDAGKIQRLLPENLWVLRQSDRVQIDDAIKTIVLVLQRDPVFECTKIVSYVKLPSGLGTAEDTFFH